MSQPTGEDIRRCGCFVLWWILGHWFSWMFCHHGFCRGPVDVAIRPDEIAACDPAGFAGMGTFGRLSLLSRLVAFSACFVVVPPQDN